MSGDKRTCPACSTRYAGLVDPLCVICGGVGTLTLGDAALSIYEPEIVAQAVAIALEAVARKADETLTIGDDRAAPVREAVADLVEAGVISAPDPPAPKPRRPRNRPRKRDDAGRYVLEAQPSKLAEECVQVTIDDLDARLINADPYRYTEDDRPNARGLPLLSANGHPSHLARITDPEEPGNSTMATVRARQRERLHARALLSAVPAALQQKRSRQATA